MSFIATAVIGGAVVSAGASYLGGKQQAKAIDRQGETQAQIALETTQMEIDAAEKTLNTQLGFARESRDWNLGASRETRDHLYGLNTPGILTRTRAQAAMADMMGLDRSLPEGYQAPGTAPEDPIANPSQVAPRGRGLAALTRTIAEAARRKHERDTGFQPETLEESLGFNPADVYADADTYNWEESPSYQFRVDEGMRAIESSAAARGGVLSGANLRDLMTYGQEMGSLEFDKIYNRLGALAGTGGTGATGAATAGGFTASAGSQFGSASNMAASQYGSSVGGAIASGGAGAYNAANSISGSAAATAAGWTGVGNAFGSALSQYGFMAGMGGLNNTSAVIDVSAPAAGTLPPPPRPAATIPGTLAT